MSTSGEHSELRVSTLELFFDLVFVFTITQLTALVEHHVSLLGVARAGLVFVVLYWMYGGYAWLTNQVPPTTASRRLLLVGGMVAFLICALAIPQAFEQTALPSLWGMFSWFSSTQGYTPRLTAQRFGGSFR